MIFNTITNDLNGAINKIGIFNRSFADLKNAISANGIKGLFTMDTSDMSVGDITSQVDSYINTIATVIGEDSTELKIKFGFDDTDTLPLINNVKAKLQDEFADRVGELKIDELQIAAGLEIPNATLLSWDELITKIKEIQNSTANETPFHCLMLNIKYRNYKN